LRVSQEQAKRAVQGFRKLPRKAVDIAKGAVKQHLAERRELHQAVHKARIAASPEVEKARALSAIEVSKARALQHSSAPIEPQYQQPTRYVSRSRAPPTSRMGSFVIDPTGGLKKKRPSHW
jgi:hypothetical protein